MELLCVIRNHVEPIITVQMELPIEMCVQIISFSNRFDKFAIYQAV